MADTEPRRFLFLQGPHGPYFFMLGQALRERGHDTFRINLNGGDRRDWPGEATDYRHSFRNWPLFFDDYVVQHGITDLILYGDCRPYHASAHGMARLRGLRVHVMEEGYIRPDFMTLEADGVNGNSTLPTDPQWYLDQARALPDVETLATPISSDFRRRAQNTMRNGLASTMGRLRFPYYRTHRPDSFLIESFGWAGRLLMRKRDRAESGKAWDQVRNRPYFTLPLQLNSDYQIRVHSPFGDMRAALRFVIKSFASAAPDTVNLVVKRHPLDAGLIGWGRHTRKLAAQYGVADRVFYLSDWDIAEVVAHSLGVVTVNSTVGTLALNSGKPVTVLGHAVYKVPGIVYEGALDGFWRSPPAPDMRLYSAFRRVLEDRCLVRGGLLSDEGLAMLVANAVERLTGARGLARSAGEDGAPGGIFALPRRALGRQGDWDV